MTAGGEPISFTISNNMTAILLTLDYDLFDKE